MKKLLSILAFLFVTYNYGQTFSQTFVDRCTGEVQVVNANFSNGSAVVAFYDEVKLFTYTEFTNGTLQSWLVAKYNWWQALSPCSQAQQQTQTAQNAANNASNAASNASNATNNATQNTGTTNTGSTNTGGTTSGSSGSTSSGSTSSGSSSSGSSSSGSSSGGDSGSGSDSSGGDAGGNSDSGSGDNSGGSSDSGNSSEDNNNNTEGDNNGESEGQGDSGGSEGSSEESNTEGSGEDSSEESSETDSEESGEGSEESDSEDSESDEVEEEKKEEESEEKSEEESEEESEESEEESEEEESDEEESEEESEDDSEEEEEEEEERRMMPIQLRADVMQQQALTLEYNSVLNIGASQSSIYGDRSYNLNGMIWDNLKQFGLSFSTSVVSMTEDYKVSWVDGVNVSYMRNYTMNAISFGANRMKPMGKYGTVGIGINYAYMFGKDALEDKMPDTYSLGYNFLYTNSFQLSPRINYAPAFIVAQNPLTVQEGTEWKTSAITNNDVMGILANSFTVQFTKRFSLNLGWTVIASTNEFLPIMNSFMVGSKIPF